MPPTPPVAPRREHRDNDEYHWLRDKSDPAVIRYLEAENAYTAAVTSHLEPFQAALYKEMLARIRETDLSVPVRRGGYLYYTRTEQGQQYPIQCRRPETRPGDSMDNPEQILLDLNELAQGHGFISLGAFVVSDDQNLLAYTADCTGFRQYTLYVKDLRTGATLPGTAERVTSLVWAADNATILLTTEDPVTKRSDTLLRHVLGAASFDKVYEETDELFDIALAKTRDRQYLFLHIESKDTTEFRYLRAADPAATPAVFLPREKKHRYYPDHRAGIFYIRTDKNATNFRRRSWCAPKGPIKNRFAPPG